MKKHLMLLLLLAMTGPVFSQTPTELEKKFFTMQMADQQKYWNLGDIDGYMSYYWASDSLIFISGGKVKLGWQNIRDGYEKKYPDQAHMGTLEFSNLIFYKLDKKKILCAGSWKLTRTEGDSGGTFTLIWKKIKGHWVIIIDHTE